MRLYLDVPPRVEGQAVVVVTTPGEPVLTIQPGIRYSGAVLEIAVCVQQSFIVVVEDLIEEAEAMAQSGTLDAQTKSDLAARLEIASRDMDDPMIDRATLLNYSLKSPALMSAVEPYFDTHATLIGTLRAMTS
jgi:hypothetical protein